MRPAAVAGTFYEADAAELARTVDGLLAGERRAEEKWNVHAGPTELLREPQAGRENDGPDEAAGKGSPDRHGSRLASSR